jgi:DNA (cytosine-5)-methyltransferase 1
MPAATSNTTQMISVVDLFAGAGGLSCGLQAAGATPRVAVEVDADAAWTYSENHPTVEVVTEEITLGWRPEVDFVPAILAGGPPCQGWSTLGHRGSEARRARHNAGIELFLNQVEILQPWSVLLENVRGLALAERGGRIRAIESRLRGLGYEPATALVRACDYGVPQLRHRLFIVAVRRELGLEYTFPASRTGKPPTVDQAISDLPSLAPGDSIDRYHGPARTRLQRRLRKGSRSLTWHRAPSHPEHIIELLGALPPGGHQRDVPKKLRPRSGFHNTYGRLSGDHPAPAVTSSIGRISSGRHAHPRQNRALTPREAARLQTFRDTYAWMGRGQWSVYRQIGNAVPPDLAAAIARPLVDGLLKAGVSA